MEEKNRQGSAAAETDARIPQVGVRMTEDDYALVSKAAKQSALRMGSWVRMAAVERARREVAE